MQCVDFCNFILLTQCFFNSANKDDDLASPTELYQRRYHLEKAVDFGMSAVKLATDIKTGKKVALKFVPDLETFKNESATLQGLRSEYVVDLVDTYEVEISHHPQTQHNCSPDLMNFHSKICVPQDPQNKSHCIIMEYASQNLADFMRFNRVRRYHYFRIVCFKANI
jgi:serine/threonine protein kinase